MKPIRKLVLKNLLMNKTRTIVTIIGIVLSVALITSIIGFLSSGMTSMNNAKFSFTGDYEVMFEGTFNDDSVAEIKANRNIKDVYFYNDLGVYKPENSRSEIRPFVSLAGTNKASFDGSCCKLKEGRFPENDHEIIISSTYGRFITRGVSLGDEIVLEKGARHYTKEYILENNPDINEESLQLLLNTDLPGNVPYEGDGETFTSQGKEKFKVVGIVEYADGFLGFGEYDHATVFTYSDKVKTNVLYLALTDEGLKSFTQTLSQITGVDENLILDVRTERDIAKQTEQLSKNTIGITQFSFNSTILEAKGVTPTTDLQGTLVGIFVVALIMVVVCGSCVFIIRNSFNISLNDKIKLYGMLSSIGSTPNQLRMSVFFEAALLGLIGVPLGILLGYAVTGGLMALANALLGDMLGSFEIAFNIPYYAALIAAALGIGTVMMSAYNSSVEASRVTPLEAIRSSKSVNIRKRRKGRKKEKDYKTPKLIKKMFGAGGSIAWKNMKRSRKQYRTTIISIVVSTALFITVSCFVEKLILYTSEQDMFKSRDYNIYITTNCSDINGKNKSLQEMKDYANQVLGMGEVTKYRYALNMTGDISAEIPVSELSEELRSDPDAMLNMRSQDDKEKAAPRLFLIAIDDESYADYCKKNGIDPQKERNAAFIYNRFVYLNDYLSEKPDYKFLDDPVGKTYDFTWKSVYFSDVSDIPESYKNCPNVTLEKIEYDLEEGDYEYDENGKLIIPSENYLVTERIDLPLKIGGLLENDFSLDSANIKQQVIAVSFDCFEKNVINKLKDYGSIMLDNYYSGGSFYLNIDSPAANDLEDKIRESGIVEDFDYGWISNIYRIETEMKSMLTLVQIIVYGFIILISLIGITNIFNTITTNMSLRRKEFAMLRSIGMTKREFNRLVQLESMMYTVKSLLIGLPLGLLGCWAVNAVIDLNPSIKTPLVIPWLQIIISVVVVLALLWTIMKFSVSKVSKMNIIETIRNDNI